MCKAFRQFPVAVALILSTISKSQQPAADAVPDVHLEAHDGQATFYLGEPIRLDLVFENRTGSPFMLNNAIYGDLSENVEIRPESGWFQWQTQSEHDYSTVTSLNHDPIRIPVSLDEGFVFREPGEYRVRLTTARLMRGNTLGGAQLSPITTNQMVIEIQRMPADVEAAKVRQIQAALASPRVSGNRARSEATRSLAALQGEDALAEKIRLLEDVDDDFRRVHREAFATTHNLQKQLAMLKQAWTDPKLTPEYDTPDALNETRLLLAGRNLPGWHMMAASHPPDAVEQRIAAEHRADMVALLDSMPARRGESRTMGAYFLIEFGSWNEAQRAGAVDYAVQEFPNMNDTAQHMLLETARPPLRDARLIPILRSMLDVNTSDQDVVAALLAIAPAESTKWIVKSVCSPTGVVLLDAFKDADQDRVPEVDQCLGGMLRTAPSNPREEIGWKQRATEAARFATPSVLPALREGWKSAAQDSAVLAVFIRDDPAAAVELLKNHATARELDGMMFLETREVYKQILQPFPQQVLNWLRNKLANGTDKEASTAAYALSIGGDASDSGRVERRLEQLRERWEGKELTSDAVNAEQELASALGSYGSKAFIDATERNELGQGCMSEQCRLYLH